MPDDSGNLLETAIQQHVAGRLPEAEVLYQRILAADPNQTDALHMLGMLTFQLGKPDAALPLVSRAISLNSAVPRYHGHLGMILASLGRLSEAVVSYRRALELDPGAPSTLNNLAAALESTGDIDGAIAAYREALKEQPDLPQACGNLGLILHRKGQFAEAAEMFRKTLSKQPNDANILLQLGNTLHSLGKPKEAIEAVHQALLVRPDWAEAHNNLGVLLDLNEDRNGALASFDKALTLQSDFADAHFNKGKTLFNCGRFEDSVAAYRKAIALNPQSAQIQSNLGISLFNLGKLHDAVACYRHAIELQPGYSEAYNNLGSAFHALGQLNDAVSVYRTAVELNPKDDTIQNNLGCSLLRRGDMDEAVAAFHEALRLHPDFSSAYDNLGNAQKERGELSAAIASYRRAVELQPDYQDAQSNLLYTLNFHPDYSAGKIYLEHAKWNQTYAAPLEPKNAAYGNDLSPARRLRIGYVAPDFREHCQAMFTLPLLSNHDRQSFEVFGYSNVAAPDAVTAQLRGYCDHWRNIVGVQDQAVADMIRTDKIDILVDLTLHMARNRLFVFARKPAPVQVTWLGYPGTTGLTSISYRLTDPYLDPSPGLNDNFYSERSVRLPDTFWCYDPRASEPAVNALPALQNRRISFGCLNNFCKVTEPTLQLWAAVLRSIPGSTLLLLAPRGFSRDRIKDFLSKEGVTGDRIDFVDRQTRTRYLSVYHSIDVGLDTVPYNGHTTTLDSMWMGVPVVTLVGSTPVGRAGWSQLCNLDLKHLAANSEEEFVQITKDLVSDLPRLAILRGELRERLASSPLMDAPKFVRNIEAAYREMWKSWVGQKPPS